MSLQNTKRLLASRAGTSHIGRLRTVLTVAAICALIMSGSSSAYANWGSTGITGVVNTHNPSWTVAYGCIDVAVTDEATAGYVDGFVNVTSHSSYCSGNVTNNIGVYGSLWKDGSQCGALAQEFNYTTFVSANSICSNPSSTQLWRTASNGFWWHQDWLDYYVSSNIWSPYISS